MHSLKKNIILISAVVFIVSLFIFQFVFKSADVIYAAAPKQVYYSAGQNTRDHKTGSPTVTISNGLATFSVAQTALNMGVGDRVTYRGNNAVFISGKISPTQWTVVTKTGDRPANVTNAAVNSIRHEFDSLFEAVSFYASPPEAFDDDHLNTSNLVTGNYILNIPLYYDTGPEVVAGGQQKIIQLNYLTTGPNNYIRIYTPDNPSTEVNQSQRHNGKWDSQKYSIEFRPTIMHTAGFTTYIPYVKVDGLQIKIISNNRDNSGLEVGYARGGWIEFSNNIITGRISQFSIGIKFVTNGGSVNGKIWNNLIYDLRGPVYGSSAGIMFDNCYGGVPCGSGLGYIYNNTVVNAQLGITNGTIYHVNAAGIMVAKNNLVQDADSADAGYKGSFHSSSDYNISNLNDAPGTHSKNNAAVRFINKAGKDFGLASSDAVAQDAGINLVSDSNLAFSTDINGQTRVDPWDIGANEIDVPVFSSASLTSTNGVSGNISLDTSLKADTFYTGPVGDTVNYAFWWNCNDSSNNISYLSQASVCGGPTNPAYGAKYDNQPGGTAATSLISSSHTYSLGVYIPKVVVERGAALPVERRIQISVANNPPALSAVAVTEPNYCLSGPAAFVSWVFSDSPGDTQSAYQVQIDDQSSFNSPEVDSGKVLSSATFFSGQGLLQVNTTYRARVKVWDSGDISSPWVEQSICAGPGCLGNGNSWKTPQHAYPEYIPFTWSPIKPLPGQPVQFLNRSICYDNNNSMTACKSWEYDFDYSSGIDSSDNPDPIHTYPNLGTYQVSETVIDNDNYSCPNPLQPQLINVSRAVPTWIETISMCKAVNAAFGFFGLNIKGITYFFCNL